MSDIELAKKCGADILPGIHDRIEACFIEADLQSFADAIRAEQRERDAKELAEKEAELQKLLKDIFGEE